MRQFRDGIVNHGANSACVKIQKFLKGFLVSRTFEAVKIHLRLNKNFDYFDELREHLTTSAQILIACHWRRLKRRWILRKLGSGGNSSRNQRHSSKPSDTTGSHQGNKGRAEGLSKTLQGSRDRGADEGMNYKKGITMRNTQPKALT